MLDPASGVGRVGSRHAAVNVGCVDLCERGLRILRKDLLQPLS
jgi:hypothetical protein